MKVTRNHTAHTISLSQEPYVTDILAKYNFTNTKPVSIPLDPHIQLSEKQSPQTMGEITCMHNIPYWQAVGSLIHLASGTGPNIAFVTSFVAQFCSNPGWGHWEAVKQIYRYLVETKTVMVCSQDLLFSIVHLSPLSIDWPLTFTLSIMFFTDNYQYMI